MSRALARLAVAAALTATFAATAPLPAQAAARRVAAKPAAKPAPRPARYVVVGTFASADATAATLTLAPTKGGNAKVAPAPVTLAVAPAAVVLRDDVAVTLADLVAGDHVAASGTKTGTTVTITKVIATTPAG